MMNKIVFSFLLSAILLAACRKDVDTFTPYNSTADELQQLLEQVPNSDTETVFAFSGSIPDTILSTASGVRLHLQNTENLFQNASGVPVPASACLNLQIRVKEYIKGGDILAKGIPVAINNTIPEVLTGFVELEVLCGGAPLEILSTNSITVDIPSVHVTSLQTTGNLFLYYAEKDTDGNVINWNTSGQAQNHAQWPLNGQNTFGYALEFTKTGLAGGFEIPNSTFGRICADLPGYYTAENTMAFLFLKKSKTSIALDYDNTEKAFCTVGIPAGLNAEILTVSKLGDQWQYVQSALQTAPNTNISLEQKNAEEATILDVLRGY